MILSILLWIVALFILFLLVLVVSPFRLHLSGFVNGRQFGGEATASFFHPLVIRVTINFSTRKPNIRLFGRQIGCTTSKKREGAPVKPAADVKPPASLLSVSEPVPPGDADEPAATFQDSGPVEEHVEVWDTVAEGEDDHYGTVVKESIVVDSVASNHAPSVVAKEEPVPSSATTPASFKRKKPPKEEYVAQEEKRGDNWWKRLQQHVAVHFLRNQAWRSRVISWLLRFLRSLFSLIRFDRFRMSVKAGIEDPVITGTVAGYVDALRAVLTQRDRHIFMFEPVFMENYFSGTLQFRVTTSLFMALSPFVFAIVSFPWIRTLFLWLSYRRKKKQYQKLATA